MIFVAVGTQFAFDRLIRYVDEWCGANQHSGVAQIAGGAYLPAHLQWERFMTTDVFNGHLKQADLIISHAGMGNIITALEAHKPIIVMNRQFELGEHRNNHQGEGLEWMSKLPGVYTASTEAEMLALLNRLPELQPAAGPVGARRQALTNFINQAIRA